MPKRYFIFLLFFLPWHTNLVVAQIVGDVIESEINSDPVNLVRDIFITGSCKNVENIERSGQLESFGVFNNGENIIGLPDGIIMSTGDVRSAIGPNNFVETSTQFDRPSSDNDLMDIATDDLFDVAVLEFDFIPVESEVTFKYVFASEEYCEFVGTDFNDVFGFFVSGPGIDGPYDNGAINVARLPDSDEFVSINSVNHEVNVNYYVKNELRDDVGNCDIEFNPSNIDAIEYDGYTVPLLARFRVMPCETYHIRLVVGDVADDKLDSVVFLESNSFDLGEVATVIAKVPNQDEAIAYENCVDGQFIFKRPEGGFNLNPLQLNFEIDDISTASEGVDYVSIAKTITIPGGEDSIVLSIQTLTDDQSENLERLKVNLNLSLPCDCEDGSSATLFFADAVDPAIFSGPIYACIDQPFVIRPQVIEGVPPYNFRWEDNSTDSILQSTIQAPTYFGITVTDDCNNQVVDSVQANIQEMPIASLSGEVDFCLGLDEVTLPITFGGFPPWSFTYQVDINEPVLIDSIYDSDFNLPIVEPGSFRLIEFTDAACTGEASGIGQVNDINIQLSTEVVEPSCPNENDGQIDLEILSANSPYEISWDPVLNDPTNPSNLSVGVYELVINDSNNCVFMDSILIENPALISPSCELSNVYIPNTFSPDGDGVNDFFEIFIVDDRVMQVQEAEIIDRWGNLVYSSKNELPLWDGRLKGKVLSAGVFVYHIKLALTNGKTEFLHGDLTLIR